MIVLKKEDKPGNDQKLVPHDIGETKIKIPEFTIPDSTPKRVKKNDRNIQFTRSVKRIFDELGEEYEDEEEELEEPTQEKEMPSQTDPLETKIPDTFLREHDINPEKNTIDDLKKSKVASLLKQAQEISKKELE